MMRSNTVADRRLYGRAIVRGQTCKKRIDDKGLPSRKKIQLTEETAAGCAIGEN